MGTRVQQVIIVPMVLQHLLTAHQGHTLTQQGQESCQTVHHVHQVCYEVTEFSWYGVRMLPLQKVVLCAYQI